MVWIVDDLPACAEPDHPVEDPFADPEDPFVDPITSPGPAENIIGHVSRPKLLTRAHKGLDITHDNIDFVGTDVDASRAPRGLTCSKGFTYNRAQRKKEKITTCVLCDSPDLLKLIQELGGCGDKVNEKGKQKENSEERKNGVFHKTAQIGTAAVKLFRNTINSSTKRPEKGSKEYIETGEDEAPTAAKRAEWERKQEEGQRRGLLLDSDGNPVVPLNIYA